VADSRQCGASRHFRLCASAMDTAKRVETPIANQHQTPLRRPKGVAASGSGVFGLGVAPLRG
jgi:hypothetical protein